jgi:hypothetical protein
LAFGNRKYSRLLSEYRCCWQEWFCSKYIRFNCDCNSCWSQRTVASFAYKHIRRFDKEEAREAREARKALVRFDRIRGAGRMNQPQATAACASTFPVLVNSITAVPFFLKIPAFSGITSFKDPAKASSGISNTMAVLFVKPGCS